MFSYICINVYTYADFHTHHKCPLVLLVHSACCCICQGVGRKVNYPYYLESSNSANSEFRIKSMLGYIIVLDVFVMLYPSDLLIGVGFSTGVTFTTHL